MEQRERERKEKELTLSGMWYRASRELTQVKGYFGNPQRKEACAVGAITCYLSGSKTCNHCYLQFDRPGEEAYERLITFITAFTSLADDGIEQLNDKERWTFKDFADFAYSHGL